MHKSEDLMSRENVIHNGSWGDLFYAHFPFPNKKSLNIYAVLEEKNFLLHRHLRPPYAVLTTWITSVNAALASLIAHDSEMSARFPAGQARQAPVNLTKGELRRLTRVWFYVASLFSHRCAWTVIAGVGWWMDRRHITGGHDSALSWERISNIHDFFSK